MTDQLPPAEKGKGEVEWDEGHKDDEPDECAGDEHETNRELHGAGNQQKLRVVDASEPDRREKIEMMLREEGESHRDVPDLLRERDDRQSDSERHSQHRN